MFNSSKKTTQHIHHINHRSTIPTAGFSVVFLIFSLKTRRKHRLSVDSRGSGVSAGRLRGGSGRIADLTKEKNIWLDEYTISPCTTTCILYITCIYILYI